MKSKLVKIKSRLSSKNYDEELIEYIKGVETYKIFTPQKVGLICEEREISNIDRGASFIESTSSNGKNIAEFLIYVNKPENLTPIEAFFRYEVKVPEYPQYPGKDYTLDIHDSEIINKAEDIDEDKKEDIDYVCKDRYPFLKVRGEIIEGI